MYIGRIGAQRVVQTQSMLKQIADNSHTAQTKDTKQRKYNLVDLSAPESGTDPEDIGLYQRNGCRLRVLEPEYITYGDIEDAPDLTKELLPPSESSYTEKDALENQYAKQYRLDIRLVKGEDGEYVAEGEGGRVFLPDMVNDEEWEAFRQNLVENGLGEEIDWRGVESDLFLNNINFGNAERLDTKVDYLSSCYAVLKDRIEKQYTGDRAKEQMDILNSIYQDAKEILADSYAESIGGFFEDLGQEGMAGQMRESLLSAIDQRTAEYESYLSETGGDYAHIENPEDQWLYQDDGFMAAQLRESMGAAGSDATGRAGEGVYSIEDLIFAGVYATVLNEQLEDVSLMDYNGIDDSDIGKKLAAQYKNIQNALSKAGVSGGMASAVKDTFKPFMEKLMDRMDEQIDDYGKDWVYGIRTNHIDRDKVYQAFKHA